MVLGLSTRGTPRRPLTVAALAVAVVSCLAAFALLQHYREGRTPDALGRGERVTARLHDPVAPAPSGGSWDEVDQARAHAWHGRLEGYVAFVHWRTPPSRSSSGWRTIRLLRLRDGSVRELRWSSGSVSLPTFVDSDHVLFSSDDRLACVADVAAGTVRVVASTPSRAGLGFAEATRSVAYAGPPPSQQDLVGLWMAPVDGESGGQPTAVGWAPEGDSSTNRRLRFSRDGHFVAVPELPTQVAARYSIKRLSDGGDVEMDHAAPGDSERYCVAATGVDFGTDCVYWLCAPWRGHLCLILTPLTAALPSPRLVREISDTPAAFGEGLAVSDALAVCIVEARSETPWSERIALAPLAGGPVSPLCDGFDPDIWPRHADDAPPSRGGAGDDADVRERSRGDVRVR